MAAADVVGMNPARFPVAGVSEPTRESTSEISRLMQENHEKHNVFFNERGFHNHIAHHLLSVYALGASPAQISHAYRHNSQYQVPQKAQSPQAQAKFADPDAFIAAMGDGQNYADFLAFFTAEIAARGVVPAINEYLLKGDARAETMYCRLYSSILHPFIHLGLALEFGLPAMAAEALAWTAVHKDEHGDFIRQAEALAGSSPAPSPPRGLADLFRAEMTPEIQGGVTLETFMKNTTLYTTAKPALTGLAAAYRVTPDNVSDRALEAINVVPWVTMGAQRPPYTPKVNFFNLHMMNATIFLPVFVRELAPAHAARVMEGFSRTCLLMYASQGAPTANVDYALSFARDPSLRARQARGTEYPDWQSLYKTSNALDDDGHVAKAVRALRNAEIAAGSQSAFEEVLKREDMLDLAAVLMRSVEAEGDFVAASTGLGPSNRWIMLSAFEEGWKKFDRVE